MKFSSRISVLSAFALLPTTFSSCEKDGVLPYYELTITVSPDETGIVTGAGKYKYGEEVIVEAVPNEGFLFVSWTRADEEVSQEVKYPFTMPEENLTLTAVFEVYDPYTKDTITFETLSLSAESYWNGSDETGGFTIGLATFNNDYNPAWAAWSGFAYSNITDMETPGWANQYSAYAKSIDKQVNTYTVSYVSGDASRITFEKDVNLVSAKIANATYAYLSMLYGDDYSKKFEEGDWFKLIIKGFDGEGVEVDEISFYLANFLDGNSYIIDTWTEVDLSKFENVREISFALSSSDMGDWGMNTPAYFCIDDLVFRYL